MCQPINMDQFGWTETKLDHHWCTEEKALNTYKKGQNNIGQIQNQ